MSRGEVGWLSEVGTVRDGRPIDSTAVAREEVDVVVDVD